MILAHLDKSRGAIADVLSASTIHDLRIADRKGLHRHHCGKMAEQGEVAFEIFSECFVDISFGDFRRHESRFIRILWATRIVFFVIIRGGPSLQLFAHTRVHSSWVWLLTISVFLLDLQPQILDEALGVSHDKFFGRRSNKGRY